MKKLWLLALVALSTVFGCKKDDISDDQKIKDYIAANKLQAQSTPEGIYYVIETAGTGNPPTLNNRVTVKYKGYLLNGTVFDQSTSGATFQLSQLILGWQIGLQKFPKGTKGKLLIPSAYGYGSSSTGSIPANSVLVFDIEMVNIN